MRSFIRLTAVLVPLVLFAGGCLLKYDFRMPAAESLAGQVQATYTQRGIPIIIEAGTMDAAGQFNAGAYQTTLYVESSDGLGVLNVGLLQGGSQLTVGEGLRIRFDPAFLPKRIVLGKFGSGEDARIFADGALVADYYGFSNTGDMEISLPLPWTMRTLGLTTLGSRSDDSDFFVLAIEGKIVP